MSTFCQCCGCDPCDCHGAEVKHKNICVSMTPESMQQLKEIHDRTGKSKSRIVRDAIKKEYKEIAK